MKRAIRSVLFLSALGVAAGVAPGQAESDPKTPQADPIEGFVADMRLAEQRLKSVVVELSTRGSFQNDLEFSTSGTLHVLRGAQPSRRMTVSMRFADGLHSSMDSVHTADGILIYKDDPAFGEVFLQVPPVIVTDLEWAGEVLDRADLPGMKDALAEAPLGSAMLDGLRREFKLAPTGKTQRGEDVGVWVAGERHAGLGDVEIELPLATRVEAFIRTKDHALLEVVHHQGDKVLQRIEVNSLAVDVEIAPAKFVIDGRGQELRDVEKYVPLWSQIQDVISQAERKLAGKEGVDPKLAVRPSRRER